MAKEAKSKEYLVGLEVLHALSSCNEMNTGDEDVGNIAAVASVLFGHVLMNCDPAKWEHLVGKLQCAAFEVATAMNEQEIDYGKLIDAHAGQHAIRSMQ